MNSMLLRDPSRLRLGAATSSTIAAEVLRLNNESLPPQLNSRALGGRDELSHS